MQGNRLELGIYTFAELTPDPATGRVVSPAQRLRDLLEEIELFGTEVAAVRDELAQREVPAASAYS